MPIATGGKGVFCMPALPNYYASHQWLREIRRGSHGRTPLVAIDFRLPSNEMVLVGHFSEPHVQVTISEAAGIIMSAEEPLGYEILLPRSVARDEIHKVRSVPQVIGWRYYPKAKGNRPSCTCNCCIRGEYGANKLRQRLGMPDTKPASKQEMMEVLRNAKDPDAMCGALYSLGTKKRNNPEELEFLLEHPSVDVQRGLAYALRFYRGKGATSMLVHLTKHEDEQVRLDAQESLTDSGREGVL